MPRFYFHLSAPDQDFPDNIGRDVLQCSCRRTFHSVRLMERGMMISAFADCAPDLRRWTVKVTETTASLHRVIPGIFCPERMEACSSQRRPDAAHASGRDECG
jgi:hypothetical protein